MLRKESDSKIYLWWLEKLSWHRSNSYKECLRGRSVSFYSSLKSDKDCFFRQDTFKFTTKVPDTYNPVNTIEFCVCFRTPTGEHWDNNHGQNYRMTCIDPNLLSPDNSELDLNGNMVPELITPPPSSIFYWFLFGFVEQVITLQLLLYLTTTTLFIVHLTKNNNFPLWLPDQLLKQNWWQLPTVLVSSESIIEFIVFD